MREQMTDTATAVSVVSEFEARLETAEAISKRLYDIESRLGTLAGKLTGDPVGEHGNEPRPVRPGLLGKIGDAQEDSMNTLARLEGVTARLMDLI